MDSYAPFIRSDLIHLVSVYGLLLVPSLNKEGGTHVLIFQFFIYGIRYFT